MFPPTAGWFEVDRVMGRKRGRTGCTPSRCSAGTAASVVDSDDASRIIVFSRVTPRAAFGASVILGPLRFPVS